MFYKSVEMKKESLSYNSSEFHRFSLCDQVESENLLLNRSDFSVSFDKLFDTPNRIRMHSCSKIKKLQGMNQNMVTQIDCLLKALLWVLDEKRLLVQI